MSDWGRRRGSNPWLRVVAAFLVLLLVVIIIVQVTDSEEGPAQVGETPAASGPVLPERGVISVQEVEGWPSGEEGMSLPRPGIGNGPAQASEAGVPSGYSQDLAGVELAAANVVVGGLWWSQTVSDPWSVLGDLAATQSPGPGPSELGSVKDFLSGMSATVVAGDIGPAPSSEVVAATPWGLRLLGVAGSLDGTTAQVRVLALAMGEVPLQGTGIWFVDVNLQMVWERGDWRASAVQTGWTQTFDSMLPVTGLPQEDWLM